jgi:hypothetical protein
MTEVTIPILPKLEKPKLSGGIGQVTGAEISIEQEAV